MASATDHRPAPLPDGGAWRLLDALASVPGVPGPVASAAHRLRATRSAGLDPADALARTLLERLDTEVLAARWVELTSGVGGDAPVDRTEVAAGPAEAALAAGATAVADLLVDLAGRDQPDGEPHALRARRRAYGVDGAPAGWTYEAEGPDGSLRLVRVSDDGRNAPLTPGETVRFEALQAVQAPDPADPRLTHRARGALGLPSAADRSAAQRAASRRLVLALALGLGRRTPLGALAAAVHRSTRREVDPDVDPLDLLARRLRDGELRGPPDRHARHRPDAAVVAGARRYLARLAGEPREDALADAAEAFPGLSATLLADLWDEAAGRRNPRDGRPLPSRA